MNEWRDEWGERDCVEIGYEMRMKWSVILSDDTDFIARCQLLNQIAQLSLQIQTPILI